MTSPYPGQGRVNFLVEVCDPCEASDFAYSVNGVFVSDFYTPNYFDPVPAPGVRYSYSGWISAPRQVLYGGYLSWQDPTSAHWWQQMGPSDGGQARFRELGPIDPIQYGSFRTAIDRSTAVYTKNAIARGRKKAGSAGLPSSVVAEFERSFGPSSASPDQRTNSRPGDRRRGI